MLQPPPIIGRYILGRMILRYQNIPTIIPPGPIKLPNEMISSVGIDGPIITIPTPDDLSGYSYTGKIA